MITEEQAAEMPLCSMVGRFAVLVIDTSDAAMVEADGLEEGHYWTSHGIVDSKQAALASLAEDLIYETVP